MKIGKIINVLSTVAICCVNYAHAQEPVWDGNKVELVAEKLANGVFAYYPSDAKILEKQGKPVATSGGFIAGEKGVLIIDTMLNKRLNAQVQNMVQKETGKPIIFAVNTSFHGDHSYGNMYLPKATVVIQHSHAKKYIDEHFKADTEFMIQNFGKGRGIEDIVPGTGDILIAEGGKITLDLGGKSVDIIDFGFAQTGGDLFVWDPIAKVLWTGNPIITIKPSLPWLLDGHLLETLETLKKVYAFLPSDARVVPGHGTVMKREDIQWHIDYLEHVKTQVQAAIDDDLTLEETVKRVEMLEFSGYALFDWVHRSLNVPAAYNDLSHAK
ncbi:MAG: MBL fold metallo-hydrolase [Gammaproteobacteria bacterium]|nr:MBL fold metallo-hydrolase [Gammaproteobacteria bacterium]